MARIQQDQFIDEDDEEEVCPLCVEEFDLGDRYFRPCPCGYQICQFCYNNIKTTMNGLCPACRRPYDDKPFQFKNVTQEELLQHNQNRAAQQKKRAAAKQKEAQKREADNLSRKHLAGLRVRQRNLVYVTGMRPKIQGDRVAELLRGKEYFGQYGDIIKVVVSKSKDMAHMPNQPVGIYVTFNRKEDAAACIEAINQAAQSGDGKIRAQHGTTKYCSAYLRGETCNNRNCMFLHEPGESAESFTRQDLSNMNAISTQQPSLEDGDEAPPQHVQPLAAAAQDLSPTSPTDSMGDGSALPAGANWANSVRRGSRHTSSSVASPVVTTAQPNNQSKTESESSAPKSSKGTGSDSGLSRPTSSASASKPRKARDQSAFHALLKTAFDPNMKFCFSPVGLSEHDLKVLDTMPPLWDPQGGVKRRMMKERDAEELRKQEEAAAAALQDAPTKAESDGQPEGQGGSFQLGGEPEERPDRVFGHQSAIQPPGGFPLGQHFSLDNDFSGLSNRGSTPSQLHQSQMLLRQLQPGGSLQHQIGGHGRQPSRFSFTDSGGLKPAANLQQTKGGFQAPGQQAPFYSGVQGPPPGLKTTGTPPVNGGSMFSQGHGFTGGYGGSAIGREAERSWDVRQQRMTQDAGKREFMFPFNHNTSASSTPTPGHMGYPYGSQSGAAAFQENGGAQKQKKKGKKHRHANTSSSGGGVVDTVADPSILQARYTQNGTPGLNGGQGMYAAGQGQDNLPALGQLIDPPRRATPTLPPGLFPAAGIETPERIENVEQEPKEVDVKSVLDTSRPAPLEAPKWPTIMEEKAKQALVKPATPTRKSNQEQPLVATPIAKGRGKSIVTEPTETIPTPPKKTMPAKETHKVEDIQPSKDIVQTSASDAPTKRPHPGKLNIDTTPTATKEVDSPVPYTGSINRSSRAPSISGTSLSSRPGTPLATLAIATGSPLKRTVQPRTLRITDTPKTETPPILTTPTTAAASTPPLPPVTQVGPSKMVSRRTSIASLIQPGTPLSEGVDTMSITSTSVSRANSPPPIATKKIKKEKKPQQKRKEKDAEVTSLLSKEPVEQIAPIMARKTKSKKSKPAASGSTPAPKPIPQPVIAEEKVEDVVVEREEVPVKAPEPEPVQSPAKAPKPQEPKPTSKGKARAASSAPTPAVTAASPREEPKFNEEKKKDDKKDDSMKPITAAAILAALESTHQLAISTLSLLKPLTSQSELKKLGIDPFTSADLQNHIEQLRFELTKADEQLLKQGQAVRKDLGAEGAGAGRVSGRSFVTPHGTRLSCLTKDEEEKYLEIERRVMGEKGISRWGGGPKKYQQALKHPHSKKAKLQTALAQEDVLKALSVATESLEEAMRDATKGTNTKIEAHLGPAAVHLAQQTMPQPGRSDGHLQDFAMDAREFVNKFVPRLLDPNPHCVAVPPNEDDTHSDVETPILPGQWPTTRKIQPPPAGSMELVTPQLIADATAAAGLAPLPNLNLPTPNPSPATSAQAMDTLKEAMATAGAIAKLGASEALKSPAEILKSWDRAMAQTSGGSPKNLQIALRDAVKREGGAGSGSGPAVSVADLEREGARERAAEAKREALEHEKKFNRMVRANRKAVLGGQGH